MQNEQIKDSVQFKLTHSSTRADFRLIVNYLLFKVTIDKIFILIYTSIYHKSIQEFKTF